MSEAQGCLSSDDDDALILQLDALPLRNGTQGSLFPTQQTPQIQEQHDGSINFQDQLLKAQGEASMLRDKIFFLEGQIRREQQLQSRKTEELKSTHDEELAKVKLELQNLEDEKKFLLIEIRKASSSARSRASSSFPSSANTDASTATDESTVTELDTNKSNMPFSKKRKIEEDNTKKKYVSIVSGKATDETSEFFDFLLLHKIVGAHLSTVEILNRLQLSHIEKYESKGLEITKGESIGKCLVSLLMRCKRSLTLDKFIDVLLENLAVLIKEISLNKQESNLAVPFLVAIMCQTILFRPSAVHAMALKDLLHFISDLIKAYQHVLKQSLHVQGPETYVEPQIFQYELIDFLVMLYAFDTLETSLRILQSQPSAVYQEVLDTSLLQSLEHICKSAITISYRPILNVVFNATEILNILSGMMVVCIPNSVPIKSHWWKNLLPRLYHILERDIRNFNMFQEDEGNVFFLSRFHDCFGLVRNIGSNFVGSLIPKLIFEDRLQGIPRVISKDDIPERTENSFNVDIRLERWFLQLKDNILNLLENLLTLYPNKPEIINGELLIQLTRLMSKEQEHMIERYVGQDSTNMSFRCHLIEHLLTLNFWFWTNHGNQLSSDQIKEIDSELTMSLWRVLVSEEDRNVNHKEMTDHSNLVDKLYQLQLKDSVSYYNDAFEDMPDFVKHELMSAVQVRASKIMQVKYDECYQHMARTILESKFQSMTSMEDIDSLYLAMGL